MTTTTGSVFSDSIAAAARRERQQMWDAAQTVRAHVGAGEKRDELLACLGLADVVAPPAQDPAAVVLPRGAEAAYPDLGPVVRHPRALLEPGAS